MLQKVGSVLYILYPEWGLEHPPKNASGLNAPDKQAEVQSHAASQSESGNQKSDSLGFLYYRSKNKQTNKRTQNHIILALK